MDSILASQRCLIIDRPYSPPPPRQGFIFSTALALVAGSCIVNYCANMITAHGIGNGSTLVICTGIVTGGGARDG